QADVAPHQASRRSSDRRGRRRHGATLRRLAAAPRRDCMAGGWQRREGGVGRPRVGVARPHREPEEGERVAPPAEGVGMAFQPGEILSIRRRTRGPGELPKVQRPQHAAAAVDRIPFRATPMLATLVDAPIDRPGWVYEEKYDGIRILAYKEGARVTL